MSPTSYQTAPPRGGVSYLRYRSAGGSRKAGRRPAPGTSGALGFLGGRGQLPVDLGHDVSRLVDLGLVGGEVAGLQGGIGLVEQLLRLLGQGRHGDGGGRRA